MKKKKHIILILSGILFLLGALLILVGMITEKIVRRIPNSTDRQGSPIVIARRANRTIHTALRADCC